MAVREFDGVDDDIITATGGLSAMTYGTVAIIVKRLATGAAFHGLLSFHNSGGTYLASIGIARNAGGYNNEFFWNTSGEADVSKGPSTSQDVWYLVVVRKGTGDVTPRFSVYNYTGASWSHANGSGNSSHADMTAPGASGDIRFSFQSTDDFPDIRIAARAVWANDVHWSADATGDSAIEAAGLEDAAQNWLDESPDAMWLFNQAATTTAVEDISTTGTADESSLTGTTVVTGDDPPGFSFTIGGGDATATPSVIAATAALPQASAGAGTTVTPSVVAATSAAPQAGVNATAGPAAIAAAVSMPAWAVNVSAVPDTVATTVALPAPTVSAGGNVTATPDAIAASVGLPQAGVNVSVGPQTTVCTVALPAAAPVGAAVTTPGAIAAVVTLPQATPQAGGNVTVSPATIAATVTMPTAALNVTAGPAVIPVTVALPAPTVTAGTDTTATPATIAATVALPQATVGLGADATPETITAVVTLPAPGLNVGAGPATIDVTVAFHIPDVGARIAATSTSTIAGIAATAAVAAAASSTSTVTGA